jgi:esterase/lipase superfamily enzyme
MKRLRVLVMRKTFSLAPLLMLVACANIIDEQPIPEAINIGENERIFVATNRSVGADGQFTIGRAGTLQYLDLSISVPPDRAVGKVPTGGERANPQKDFVIAERRSISSQSSFIADLKKGLRSQPSQERELTVFVHGYNNGFSEAVFRAAQLKHDLEVEGEFLTFAWPSRGSAFGYEYDKDSVLAARTELQNLLMTLSESGIGRFNLVGHSMGGFLTMETLRQIDLQHQGWSARSLANLILISPDIDVDVFRNQVSHLKPAPQPFIIFVSSQDIALRLSARITGQPARLGNISNASDISDLPVLVIDVTAFSDDSDTSHFVVGSSPSLIAILEGARKLDSGFMAGDSGMTDFLPVSLNSTGSFSQITLQPGR